MFKSSNFSSLGIVARISGFSKSAQLHGCHPLLDVVFLLVVALAKIFSQARLITNVASAGANLGLRDRGFFSCVRSTLAGVNSMLTDPFPHLNRPLDKDWFHMELLCRRPTHAKHHSCI